MFSLSVGTCQCSYVMWSSTRFNLWSYFVQLVCAPLVLFLVRNCYADDTQLYVSFTSDDLKNLDTLHCCLTAKIGWCIYVLQLNRDKTEMQIIGPHKVSEIWEYKNTIEPIIHAFVSSRLDYCNSSFSSLNETAILTVALDLPYSHEGGISLFI